MSLEVKRAFANTPMSVGTCMHEPKPHSCIAFSTSPTKSQPSGLDKSPGTVKHTTSREHSPVFTFEGCRVSECIKYDFEPGEKGLSQVFVREGDSFAMRILCVNSAV